MSHRERVWLTAPCLRREEVKDILLSQEASEIFDKAFNEEECAYLGEHLIEVYDLVMSRSVCAVILHKSIIFATLLKYGCNLQSERLRLKHFYILPETENRCS